MYRTGMAALVAATIVSQAWAGEGLPPANPLLQVWPALSAAKDPPTPKSMASPGAPAEEKSPGRALLFSAVLPGAGEFYAGAPKRAIGFFSVEALALGAYFTWKGKGDDIEREFRSVAIANWSPYDYLAWRKSTKAPRFSSITHALPCSSAVDSDKPLTPDEIKASLKGCSGRETQQYYELIGKYNQFVAGWKDVKDRNGNYVTDPHDIDSVESFSSQTRLSYEDRRNDSNRYLKRASIVSGVIFVNHLLSAIDAAHVARLRGSGKAAALEKRTRFALVLPPERRRPAMLVMYRPFY